MIQGWTFKLPTWASIKSFIPKWLGGTKGESPEEQAKLEFNKWTFKFPTWAEISAFLPDWIKDPVGWIKGIFNKGDKAVEAEEAVRKDKKLAGKRIEKFDAEKADIEEDKKNAQAVAKRRKQHVEDQFKGQEEMAKWNAKQIDADIKRAGEKFSDSLNCLYQVVVQKVKILYQMSMAE